MNISVVGTGYVGLIVGTCMAEFGSDVICVDTDAKKIASMQEGMVPIYEPGLQELFDRNRISGRLRFTTDLEEAVLHADVLFIAVGTPPGEDGSADLTYVLQAAEEIAAYMDSYLVIVDKSTVPVGTGKQVEDVIRVVLAERGAGIPFDVVSNPEFLREGAALYEFMHPDRVVIGTESKRARILMREVYRSLTLNKVPLVETDRETAEMIKYANNTFLAVKISFINEMANLCEEVGADVHHIAACMGMDGRISSKFLHPGPGYGGSCFPKDTRALAHMGRTHNSPMTIVEAAVQANAYQRTRMVNKIIGRLSEGGSLSGKVISVLGLTFKPGTDDMRESPSLTILPGLAAAGAELRVYDPKWEREAAWRLSAIRDQVTFCQDEYEAASGGDALVILTEWNQFRQLNISKVSSAMRGRWFFDLRNLYEREYIEAFGLFYECVGR